MPPKFPSFYRRFPDNRKLVLADKTNNEKVHHGRLGGGGFVEAPRRVGGKGRRRHVLDAASGGRAGERGVLGGHWRTTRTNTYDKHHPKTQKITPNNIKNIIKGVIKA